MGDSPIQEPFVPKPEQADAESLVKDAGSAPCRPELVEIGYWLRDLEPNDGLVQIAATNEVHVAWSELKPIIKDTLQKQCDIMERNTNLPTFTATIDTIKTSIIHSIDKHEGPPFTIQRLCELMIAPRQHYSMFVKYMHAIEKVLLVSSTWDRFPESTEPTELMQGITMADLDPVAFVSSRAQDEALDDLERVIKSNVAPEKTPDNAAHSDDHSPSPDTTADTHPQEEPPSHPEDPPQEPSQQVDKASVVTDPSEPSSITAPMDDAA